MHKKCVQLQVLLGLKNAVKNWYKMLYTYKSFTYKSYTYKSYKTIKVIKTFKNYKKPIKTYNKPILMNLTYNKPIKNL